MLAWGANDQGQLGLGDTLPRISPRQVLCSSAMSTVACGSRTTIAIVLNTKAVVGFGHAGTQVLGSDLDEDCVLVPRQIDGLENIAQVATRGAHALAVSNEGEVFVWGRGEEQDQQPVTKVRRVLLPGVFVSKVAVGRMHSVCLDNTGGVYTWGSSTEGQCGKPAGGYIPAPTLLHAIRAREIACGSRHTLLVSVRGNKVYGFGGNAYAQLGLGDREPRFSPTEIASRDCFAELGEDAFLSCGYRHSFVYTRNRAWAFGWNSHHQSSPLSSDVVSTPTLLALPVPEGGEISQLAGGGRHTLLVVRDATRPRYQIWAFGRGVSGELGVAACPTLVSTPQFVLGLTTQSLESPRPVVACGWEHSVITLPTGSRRDELHVQPRPTMLGALLQFRGDLDAGVAQFAHALALLRLVPEETRVSVGMAIAMGNIVFAMWAQKRLSPSLGSSITALPHGLNAVAFFALYNECYLVVLARSEGNATRALQSCLFCTVALGAVQLAGASWLPALLKRHIPQSALQSSVAGISLSYLCLQLVGQEFALPKAGLPSLIVLLVGFGARERMPFGLPVVLVSLFVGWAASWTSLLEAGESSKAVTTGVANLSLAEAFQDADNYPFLVSVVLPLSLLNVANNVACVDQARNGGDLFSSATALQLDAMATLLGAFLFHCPFPTSTFAAHGLFKAMGAGSLFPVISAALVWLLVWRVPEAFPTAMEQIPLPATVAVLVWLGLQMTSEGFRNKKHHMALVVGLLPALGAACGGAVPGLQVVGEGFVLVSIVLASVVSHVVDRQFFEATGWLVLGSVLAVWGWIHQSKRSEMSEAYLICAGITAGWAAAQWNKGEAEGDLAQ